PRSTRTAPGRSTVVRNSTMRHPLRCASAIPTAPRAWAPFGCGSPGSAGFGEYGFAAGGVLVLASYFTFKRPG
ncbi:MAG: hypothetical protein ACHQYR_03355, partial [Candidatus Gagatemarchaeaceae archaeon]